MMWILGYAAIALLTVCAVYVYSRVEGMNVEKAMGAAFLCGIFWPVLVPILVAEYI